MRPLDQVSSWPESFKINGSLSIFLYTANGTARGHAEDHPWHPAGSCRSLSKTLQKSLDSRYDPRWRPAVGACTGRRGPCPVSSWQKTFENIRNLSISLYAANGSARGHAEDSPWHPAGSCESLSKTLQKSLDFHCVVVNGMVWLAPGGPPEARCNLLYTERCTLPHSH